MSPPTEPLGGLSQIAERYDAIFCDIWGVLHNGAQATPGPDLALAQFRAGGGRVVLVTNAPLTEASIAARLNRMGITPDAYDSIASSGDLTRAMIAPYRGKIAHPVGLSVMDEALFAGLGVIRGSAEDADVVVAIEMDHEDDTPDMYLDRMRLWLERKLPLICANPDKVVERGHKVIYCAGALADLYAEAGGEVIMCGKPYPEIYHEALRRAETAAGHPIARDRILAIGDSARTDATGAASFGLDFLFVAGPIHAADFGGADATPLAVRDLLVPTGARLAGYTSRLAW